MPQGSAFGSLLCNIYEHFFSSWIVMFVTFEISGFQHHYGLVSKELHEIKFDKCLFFAAGHRYEQIWAKTGWLNTQITIDNQLKFDNLFSVYVLLWIENCLLLLGLRIINFLPKKNIDKIFLRISFHILLFILDVSQPNKS